MSFKLLFVIGFVWTLLRLVQRERLSLDLASFTASLIVVVLMMSFSPYWVELLASILGFGTPSMAVVALITACLIIMAVILSVMVSDLKSKQARLIRQLSRLELQLDRLRPNSKF